MRFKPVRPSLTTAVTTSMALLSFFLPLLQLQAAPLSSPSASVGSIVTISGRITGVGANAGTIAVESQGIFYISPASVITVDGKAGNISNLVAGMKVTGSAEVAQAESRFAPRKKIVRMLSATSDPSYVRPAPFAGGMIVNIRQRLSGTFWTVPNLATHGTSTLWVSLNPDGTTTSSESEKLGTWSVLTFSNVNVSSCVGDSPPYGPAVLFSPDLSQGIDTSFPRLDRFAWKPIVSPTDAMRTKAALRPPPPTIATTTAPIPIAPSAESQEAAAEVVRTNNNNLVFVSGRDGAGSGFIASIGGTKYLVTNAHVAAGISDANFKSLDGAVVPRGVSEVAVAHDIFRMALPQGGKPFEVMESVEENARIGDEVVVLGNAEGSGVINTIIGKVVGLGPNLIETDAPFVPGNSGSPIVHLKTGKVIGVATYAVTRKYDAATNEKLTEPVVRRFGYRIDGVKTWQPVNWQAFYAQASALEKVHTLTEALDNFFRDLYQNKSKITISRHTHPVIATRISQWQASKSHKLSNADRETSDANFISFLKVACQTDLANIQPLLTYDYFQRRLTQEQENRNDMAKAFTDIIRSIRE